MNKHYTPIVLRPEKLIGQLKLDATPSPIAGATWYEAAALGDGLAYSFAPGALVGANYLWADMLADGKFSGILQLTLQEGEGGPAFQMVFTMLNQCSARMRVPLEAIQFNRWRYEREGAWLKPLCAGQRIDLARVDRMRLELIRKSPLNFRWCTTAITAAAEAPPLLDDILLPAGSLVDPLGQSELHDWPQKSRDVLEVTHRLRQQLDDAPRQTWPAGYSQWGGCEKVRFPATGFFRTHHDGERWWLVDPAGCAFWSAGMDCVRPSIAGAYRGLEKALSWMPPRDGEFAEIYAENPVTGPTINYLGANFIRAFGPKWRAAWSQIALAQLKHSGFNTVANWSDWEMARAAGFPYVRPLGLTFEHTPMVYRDFPDVFSPQFARDAHDFAQQLKVTADDPAFIGYFLMNEPTWGFAQETPVEGMLAVGDRSHTREKFARFLAAKYHDDAGLAAAWGMKVTLAEMTHGRFAQRPSPAAQADMEAFSGTMVERLFSLLSQECRKVDKHHLNLGARYYTVPPEWAIEAMAVFDVFSVNCYRQRVPDDLGAISERLNKPVMIGEWHFGALDVGLPASGIGHVRDQHQRGEAFRVYVENAAAMPWCVGVHYFTHYDEPVIGRFDGENWNIGFYDVCGRPYEPIVTAARTTHERLYDIATGKLPPYNVVPDYLPLLFC